MKIYIIDDNLVYRDENDKLIYRDVFSIIHYESSDFLDPPEIASEKIDWATEKVLLELKHGDKVISGIPGVELVVDRHYADGRIERISSIMQEPAAIYSLYLHLKKIDEENPDEVMW